MNDLNTRRYNIDLSMRCSEMWHMRMQRVTRHRERERDREKWSRISNEDILPIKMRADYNHWFYTESGRCTEMREEREIYMLYILLIQCVPTDDDELAVSFRLAKVLSIVIDLKA